jgi:hypothetical protein
MCQQILVKFSDTKFNENPFSSSPVVTQGKADRYDTANGAFLQVLKGRAPEN